MVETKFKSGDIVKVIATETEHKVISHCITTRNIDDNPQKPEYIVEELYNLSDIDGRVDVGDLKFVRRSESID